MSRLFFTTDIHGSEICWKKLVHAAKFYEADILILGGDMTGKALIPIVEDNGKCKASFLGQELVVDKDEAAALELEIANKGYYARHMTIDEIEELKADQDKVDKLFLEEVIKTIERWVDYADARLTKSGVKLYVCPGNDDVFEIDDVLRTSKSIVVCEGETVQLDSDYTMLSTGWCNTTPWNTHRECEESELYERISGYVKKVPDLKRCVFNLHAPPYGSGLDEAPELDSNLKPKHAGKSMVPVGSKAVKKIIEECQPPLVLVGHIHEGKGVRRMKKSLVINPGSSYGQGILQGTLVDIDSKGVRRYMMVDG